MRSFVSNLFLLFCILLVGGCAIGSLIDSPNSAVAHELQIGMTQASVAAVLGAPSSVSPTNSRGEIWSYKSIASSLLVVGQDAIAAGSSVRAEFDAQGVLISVNAIGTEAPPQPTINSFKECAAAGYPVMRSYPGQCVTPDGRRFVDIITPSDRRSPIRGCVDNCGDGRCQEIVCMAVGCPCAETSVSCPQDCPPNSGE